jgi:ABC-type dipeptide/oligopeptide/nickel transport system permease component
MTAYLQGRLVALLPVLIGVSVAVFLMLHLTPGDPARMVAGMDATPDQVERVRHLLELDQPLYRQYFQYLGRLLRGDLGRSLITHDRVIDDLWPRYQATVELTVAAMAVSVGAGLVIGIASAVRQYGVLDNVLSVVALAGISIPAYWLGLMLIVVFSLRLRWFPVAGMGGLGHLVLPAVTLGTFAMAIVSRMTRASMLEVLGQDYIQTVRAKGVGEGPLLLRHALRNALIPILTVVGLQVGQLLGGAVLTESVFAWPGIGRFMVDAIQARDFPIVQGGVLLTALTFVLVNLVVDLLYGAVDPRIKYA